MLPTGLGDRARTICLILRRTHLDALGLGLGANRGVADLGARQRVAQIVQHPGAGLGSRGDRFLRLAKSRARRVSAATNRSGRTSRSPVRRQDRHHPVAYRARREGTSVRLAILGATGSVGRELVAQALEAGHDVTALVNSTPKPGEIDAGVTIIPAMPPTPRA